MGYVIALLVVLVLVGGFIVYMVMNAKSRGGGAAPSDPGGEGTPAGIFAPDESPLGDSAEHAGDQQDGETVRDPESSGRRTGQDKAPRVGDPGPEVVDRPR
jgi:hypothetical protein